MRSKYEFTIHHHTQLDFDRIVKDMSYVNPVAVVDIGDGKKTFVLIHNDVVYARKAISFDAGNLLFNKYAIKAQPIHGKAVAYDVTDCPNAITHIQKMVVATKRSKWLDDSLFDGYVVVTVSEIL